MTEEQEAGGRVYRTRGLRGWEQKASSLPVPGEGGSSLPPATENSGEKDEGWCFLLDPQPSSQDPGKAGTHMGLEFRSCIDLVALL